MVGGCGGTARLGESCYGGTGRGPMLRESHATGARAGGPCYRRVVLRGCVFAVAEDFGRAAADDGSWRLGLGDYGAGGDDGLSCDVRQHDTARSDPAVLPHRDSLRAPGLMPDRHVQAFDPVCVRAAGDLHMGAQQHVAFQGHGAQHAVRADVHVLVDARGDFGKQHAKADRGRGRTFCQRKPVKTNSQITAQQTRQAG